jgi:hypothetical protein
MHCQWQASSLRGTAAYYASCSLLTWSTYYSDHVLVPLSQQSCSPHMAWWLLTYDVVAR